METRDEPCQNVLLLGEEVERVCSNDFDELCKMGVKVCCC